MSPRFDRRDFRRMHGEGLFVDPDNAKWSGAFHNGKYNNGKTFVTLR